MFQPVSVSVSVSVSGPGFRTASQCRIFITERALSERYWLNLGWRNGKAVVRSGIRFMRLVGSVLQPIRTQHVL